MISCIIVKYMRGDNLLIAEHVDFAQGFHIGMLATVSTHI